MALSGTISKSITGRTYKIVWSASQSVANNTSTITCEHYLVNNATYSLYIDGRSNTCTVGGDSKSYTSGSISSSGGSTIHLGTTTHTVSHNSDGSKSVTITGVFNIQATLSGTYYESLTATGTVTLDTIARASTITSVTDITIDGNTAPTVKFTAASSSFSHKIKFRVLDYNSGWLTVSSGSTSYTYNSFKIPLDWLNSNTDRSNFSLAVDLETYSGSTKIGSDSKLFYGTVGSAGYPTCSLTTARTGQTTIACYVEGKSGVTLTATPAVKYGAGVTSIAFYDGTKLLQSSTEKTCSLSSLTDGSHTFKAVVTDTRGLTATATASITVYSYSPPVVSDLTAYRVASSSSTTQDNSGTYGYAKATFSYSSCNSLNSLSVKTIQYRATTDTSWATFRSGAASGTGYWLSGFTAESDYELRVVLTDKFGTAYSKVETVPGSFKLMNFNGKLGGVAFGKVSSKAAVESALPIYLDNAKYLAALNSNGYARNLLGINSSNEVLIGYGPYYYGEGSTYLYGDSIHVRAKKGNAINTLYGGVALTEGADLNGYTTVGNYCSNASALSASLVNTPYTGGSLSLKVMCPYGTSLSDSNVVLQEVINTYGARWVRRSGDKGATWQAWRRFYNATVLFSNDSGTTGTVPLNESASGFDFIEVYGCLQDGVLVPLVKAMNPNGKSIDMGWVSTNTGTAALLRNRITISGTSITQAYNRQVIFNATDFNSYTDSNYLMRICAVVGYR